MNDGTLVARRARLVLDNGAYSADAGFFPQLASMMAVGPYRIPNVSVEATPRVHQHHALGLGARPDGAAVVLGGRAAHGRGGRADRHGSARAAPPQHRRAGRRGARPARCSTRSARAETLERAAEMIGWGSELPEDEAIGVACGWWPTSASPPGAYVKLQRRRLRHDRHRRPGVRHRSGDGAADAGRRGAGHAAGRSSRCSTRTPTPARGTRAPPARRRPSTTAARWCRGRSDVREQLLDLAAERAGGVARRPRAGGRRCAGQGLADQVGRRRRPGGHGRRAESCCSVAGRACPRRHRSSTLRAAPGGWGWSRSSARPSSRHACAARSTARPASSACWRWPPRTTPARCINPTRRQRPGRGRRGDGDRDGADRGHAVSTTRAASSTPICSTTSCRPPPTRRRSGSTGSRSTRPNAGPLGAKGVGEPPCVPTPGAVGNAIARVTGARVHRLPMTPARVWEAMQA